MPPSSARLASYDIRTNDGGGEKKKKKYGS